MQRKTTWPGQTTVLKNPSNYTILRRNDSSNPNSVDGSDGVADAFPCSEWELAADVISHGEDEDGEDEVWEVARRCKLELPCLDLLQDGVDG